MGRLGGIGRKGANLSVRMVVLHRCDFFPERAIDERPYGGEIGVVAEGKPLSAPLRVASLAAGDAQRG